MAHSAPSRNRRASHFQLGVSGGQIRYPATWFFAAKKKTADTYEVTLTAVVEKPWHIFSQNTGKGGPIPTRVSFKANALQSVVGKTKEVGKLQKAFDQNFNTDVLFYSNKVQFMQAVRVKGAAKTTLSGTVEYMVCDDTQCLPPTKKSFDLTLQ